MRIGSLIKKLVYLVISKQINKSSDQTFLKFIFVVNSIPLFRSNFLRRVRNFLLYVPNARSCTHKVLGRPVNFLYSTDVNDDFRIDCRSNFTEYELISRIFFFITSKSAKTILDIGAYSGIYSITAALANPQSHILAFEPNPEIFTLAEINFKINNLSKRVSLMPLALSDHLGKERLYFNVSGWESATASLNKNGDNFIEVDVSTIDFVARDLDVDLIKIDVEGFEGTVFSGGLDMLNKSHPIILSEVLTQQNMLAQSQVLSRFGYGNPIQVSSDPDSSDSRNYIWFTKDKSDAVLRNLSEAKASVSNSFFA